MEKTGRVSRRTFLGGGGSALFLPSKVLGRNGFAPPSEKLNIGFIGIAGGFGRRALEELSTHNIVAVCDVDWRKPEEQKTNFPAAVDVAAKYANARRFDDWRRMLEEMDKGIDAVV